MICSDSPTDSLRVDVATDSLEICVSCCRCLQEGVVLMFMSLTDSFVAIMYATK